MRPRAFISWLLLIAFYNYTHNILDKFEFQPDWTALEHLKCPHWFIMALRWAILALWATCFTNLSETTCSLHLTKSTMQAWPAMHILYPPANCVCGRVYCFHVVRPSEGTKVCPWHFVSLISWRRVFDGISSNFAKNIHICTRQILLIKN